MNDQVNAEHAEVYAAMGSDDSIMSLPRFGPSIEEAAVKPVEVVVEAAQVIDDEKTVDASATQEVIVDAVRTKGGDQVVEVVAVAGDIPVVNNDALNTEVTEENKLVTPEGASIVLQPGYTKLIDHGPDSYMHDKKEGSSYFAVVEDMNGIRKTLWGIDIERSLEQAGAKIGDAIALVKGGKEPVQINELQGDGTFQLKTVDRFIWDTSFQPAELKQAVEGQALLVQHDALNGSPKVSAADALRSTVESINGGVLAARAADAGQPKTSLSDAELAFLADKLKISGGIRPDQMVDKSMVKAGHAVPVSNGQRAQMQGVAALVEGAGAALGGAMSLVGAVGRGVGSAAHGLASIAGSKGKGDQQIEMKDSSGSLTAVLPRLSEWRVNQTEKAAQEFGVEQEAFWNASPKLVALRGEMERVARERGVPMQDIVEKMKPGGDLAELRVKFNEAVSDNPAIGTHKKAMDKALDGYIRQFGRAQEEVLNPDMDGNPHYDGLKARLGKTHEDMEKKSAGVPGFQNATGGLEQSHYEKLSEAVALIMEKIKEALQSFVAMIKGKRGDDHAPAP